MHRNKQFKWSNKCLKLGLNEGKNQCKYIQMNWIELCVGVWKKKRTKQKSRSILNSRRIHPNLPFFPQGDTFHMNDRSN